MIQHSYDMISKIVREAKGFTLDDNPCSLQDMIRAYDNVQYLNRNCCELVSKLLADTQLWFSIIKNHSGVGTPKYIVGSNNIASACIAILKGKILDTCFKASTTDLERDSCHILLEMINKLHDALSQIKRFCVVPETYAKYNSILQKLLQAKIDVEAAVINF